MNSEPSVPNCPQCGVAIPADAPQGLCPRCVLLGAATTTDAGKPVPRTEPPSPEALRAAFPHLEIVELIGRGGMGFVYKARQAKLDRLVALKLLPLELGADPHFAERFHREARALARLNHPGIVAVYDFGVSAGFGYLLMEFVDGVNLRQAMQAGRFTQREALALVPKICAAIQFAHEQGVLHRDIKPENILLDTQGRVKIADFGIAKLVGEETPDLTLTLSGARLGTPSYMAPEQVEHPGTVDHRADIYSLGVVFYELLTGELPLGRFAPPSAKADLDARVDDIVMRALAKERELRQQSAGEVKTQVETVAQAPAPAADAGPDSLRVTSAKQWMRNANGEYRSSRRLWGWPLLHVAFGRDPVTGRPRVARGIIAIGERAVGGLAIGGLARGVVAFGGLALGLVSVGGLSVGAFAFGGLAAGLVSFGGMSLGLLLALGGIGIGWNAGGGLAIGQTVAGGLGLGTTVWDARMQHPDARWLLDLLQSGGLRLLFFAVMIVGTILPTVATVWARGVVSGRWPGAPAGSPIDSVLRPSGVPRWFTGLKVAGWAVVWLLILFLAPSIFPALRRTAGLPDDALLVGRLFYLILGALAGLWTLAGCWVFRAEQRRHGTAAAWPNWGRGVALLLLVCTVLSVGRSLVTLWANAGREVAMLVVPGEVGILATSLAILLRRHDLRLVATSGLSVHGLLTVVGFGAWLIWRLRGGAGSTPATESAWGLPNLWLFAGSLLLVALGFATLWQRELAETDLRRAIGRWVAVIGATALVLVTVLTGFLAIRRDRSQAQFNQWLGGEMVSRMELQLPARQFTAIRATAWINGVPTPLRGAGMSLSPGLLGDATVLHWRLRRLNAPGEWQLAVTGADEKMLLGPVTVNLGPNVTALQPPANARLAPTNGTVNRWWPFLPSFVKGNGVTSADTTFGWGISVDVGPQDAMTGAGAGAPKP